MDDKALGGERDKTKATAGSFGFAQDRLFDSVLRTLAQDDTSLECERTQDDTSLECEKLG